MHYADAKNTCYLANVCLKFKILKNTFLNTNHNCRYLNAIFARSRNKPSTVNDNSLLALCDFWHAVQI